MGPRVATAAAFAASGAAWLVGFAVYDPGVQLSFFLVVSCYVVLGSLLLGVRSDRLVSTLTGLWLVAAALVAVMISGVATTSWMCCSQCWADSSTAPSRSWPG